jgi:hypothetical protein
MLGVKNFTMRDSRVENNQLGMKLFDVSGYETSSNVKVRNTVFTGNKRAVKSTSQAEIDARYNYWGQASGPEGGQVEGNVAFQPWLLEEEGQIFEKTVAFEEGWSSLSTGRNVEVAEVSGGESAFEYRPESPGANNWRPVDLEELETTDATVVGPDVEAAGFNYSDSMTNSAGLGEGWNFVGLRDGDSFDDTLSTVSGPSESFAYPEWNTRKSDYTEIGESGVFNAQKIFDSRDVLGGDSINEMDGYWIQLDEPAELSFVTPQAPEGN